VSQHFARLEGEGAVSQPDEQSEVPEVQVLLATYNGERFLREQIDSIMRQTYAPVGILARDDGSSDGTVAILREYANGFPERFRVLEGSATGHAKWNFLCLLEASTAEYLAFADQDDVWAPDKIELEMKAMRGLEEIHGGNSSLLVFTDLSVVDQSLNILRPSFWACEGLRPENVRRLQRMLMQNVVTGCTVLINRPLAKLTQPMPASSHMHDWWIALLASAFGHAEFLATPTVLYRQHDQNVLGASGLVVQPQSMPKWRQHRGRRESWERNVGMAEALLQAHGGSLSKSQLKTVEALLQCERHPNRVVRVATWLMHGFFAPEEFRVNAGRLWYLWDMDAAKRAQR
jgi:hypothetical protein